MKIVHLWQQDRIKIINPMFIPLSLSHFNSSSLIMFFTSDFSYGLLCYKSEVISTQSTHMTTFHTRCVFCWEKNYLTKLRSLCLMYIENRHEQKAVGAFFCVIRCNNLANAFGYEWNWKSGPSHRPRNLASCETSYSGFPKLWKMPICNTLIKKGGNA